MLGRYFALPPVFAFDEVDHIVALTSAESKDRLFSDVKNLSAHQLPEPSGDRTRFSSAPFLYGIGFQQVVVIMRAFHEQHIVWKLPDFLQYLPFSLCAFPDKSEIPAYNQRVVLFKLPEQR